MSSNTHIPHNDLDCWARFLSGDMVAMEQLYKFYYSPLLTYGVKLSQDQTVAEDSLQDLFLTLWKNRKRLAGVNSVKSYLFKAYRNHLLNKVIQNKNLAERYKKMDEEGYEVSVQDIIIENEFNQERLQEINGQINNLPARQREILYLRFYRGVSIAEIAQILEITNQSVRNAIYTSLSALRDVLSPYE